VSTAYAPNRCERSTSGFAPYREQWNTALDDLERHLDTMEET